MSLFSSHRERRLWIWVALIMVAIYSTLGLASTFTKVLRDYSLLSPLFFVCMLLVAATVVSQGLQVKPRGAEIAVGIGIVAVYMLLGIRLLIPEERSHLLEYSVVAIFIYEALQERVRQGRKVPLPAVLAILAATLLGVLDECIQAFLPSRVFDPFDMLFNFLASLMAILASVSLAWLRQNLGKDTGEPK